MFHVPGEFTAETVILVQVGALVRKDHVGREIGLHILEERLDSLTLVGN
jgi:hypothetical protein